MTTAPVAVHPDDLLLDAIARMHTHNVRHLPVVDGDSKLRGIVSDRDLRGAVASAARELEDESRFRRLASWRVQHVMTLDVITTEPDRPVTAVAGELASMNVGALPVVDRDGALLGIVSIVDLLRALARRPGTGE